MAAINYSNVIAHLERHLRIHYGVVLTSSDDTVERLVAEKLFHAYQEILTEYTVEDTEEIVLEPPDSSLCTISRPFCTHSGPPRPVSADDDMPGSMTTVGTGPVSSGDEYEPAGAIERRYIPWDVKKRVVALAQEHPHWGITTLRTKGGTTSLTSKSQLWRWKRQVELGFTHHDTFQDINRYVLDRFHEARSESKFVTTANLKQWAFQRYMQLGNSGFTFKASSSWADRFKRRNRISHRKVTRLVSRRYVKDTDEIANNAEGFRQIIKEDMRAFPPQRILNTDQCGFNYELLSNRTLTNMGEKVTFGYAQSPRNKATHSYTVQYTISMAGDIVGDVFVCLQEANGKIGPRMEASMSNVITPHMTVTCSQSGKMSTSLYEYYLREVPAKAMKDDFLLIVDSWSGQTNLASYSKIFGQANNRPNCLVRVIPEGCTSLVQPLDTTFHRQLKYLARAILSQAELFEDSTTVHPDDNWTSRPGVLKLQSLLHHQLSAPIFAPMIRYSFFSAGFLDDPPAFLNVKEVCFTFLPGDTRCRRCLKDRFIKCSRCRNVLCLSCFYFEQHSASCES